jgi:acetyl-CoA carboxylase carboxyl transferase subunit beta
MNWLNRAKRGIRTWRKKNLPDGLWEKCPSCGEILYVKELARLMSVCSKCDYHFRIGAREYLDLMADENSFIETERELYSADPLNFKDSRKYKDRIAEARKKTGMNSAVITGTATIGGKYVGIGILDFGFLGGSMGSVVGEKISRLAKVVIEKRIPLVLMSASGGARMQESILSLMQMAKTSAAISSISEAGLPYISILRNPTTGGVAASFAFQGDIIIAEPKALIGFAGPRVIRETVGEKLPEGFQRSEFLLEHGMIDMIVSRRSMKQQIEFLLDVLMCGAAASVEEKMQKNGRTNISLIR